MRSNQKATFRDYASAFELGLVAGAVDVADVVAWVDCVIARHDKAPDWTLEVSLAATLSPADVAMLLHDVPGQEDAETIWALFCGLLLQALTDGLVKHRRVSSHLYGHSSNDRAPGSHSDDILWIEVHYDSCDDGWNGAAQVDDALIEYLSTHNQVMQADGGCAAAGDRPNC
jgi:hypothetical protein